jgi:polysaccharide biosynthesis/export protein
MRRPLHYLSALLAALCCSLAVAQTPCPNVPHTEQAAAIEKGSSPIGSGDLLQITVEGAADFNREVRVGPDGSIMLPMVGKVPIAGLSVENAQHSVAKRLADGGFFNDPQVGVFVKEYATQGISVLGEVTKPGIYQLLGQHSLFDAISAAGGATEKAGNTVLITHKETHCQEQVVLPTDQAHWQDGNVPVYPGDTVLVTKAGVVYVVGEVKQPGGFIMEKARMTVLQALARAQGTTPDASIGHARLIRTDSSGRHETDVPLKEILSSKSDDMELKADDILFIPTNRAKVGARKGLDTILQAAAGAVIYRF